MSPFSTCPRCHFRLPPAAHICRTCGYTLNVKKDNTSAAAAAHAAAADASEPKARGWGDVFGLRAKEQRPDEPALGET